MEVILFSGLMRLTGAEAQQVLSGVRGARLPSRTAAVEVRAKEPQLAHDGAAILALSPLIRKMGVISAPPPLQTRLRHTERKKEISELPSHL